MILEGGTGVKDGKGGHRGKSTKEETKFQRAEPESPVNASLADAISWSAIFSRPIRARANERRSGGGRRRCEEESGHSGAHSASLSLFYRRAYPRRLGFCEAHRNGHRRR